MTNIEIKAKYNNHDEIRKVLQLNNAYFTITNFSEFEKKYLSKPGFKIMTIQKPPHFRDGL